MGRQLALALKGLQAHLDRRLAEQGSSFHTYLVLRGIQRSPGVSQRALASRLGIESSTVTHHLDRLAAEGLIERVRSTEDRRVWSATLTPAGEQVLAATVEVADGLDGEVRDLFDDAEWRNLSVCLDRITATYGRHRFEHDDAVHR